MQLTSVKYQDVDDQICNSPSEVERKTSQKLLSIIKSFKTNEESKCVAEVQKYLERESPGLSRKHTDLTVTWNHKDKESVVSTAAKKGYWHVVRFLIDQVNFRDWNSSNKEGYSIIHYVCFLGMLDKVKTLVESKTVDINEPATDAKQSTPLHMAVLGNHVDVVKYLVDLPDCNVDAEDKNGETALTLAISVKNLELVRIFVAKTKNLVGVDILGNSLIHYASYLGMKDKVKELLDLGVDINERTIYGGSTPLHYAIKGKQNDMFLFLITIDGCDLEAETQKGITPQALIQTMGLEQEAMGRALATKSAPPKVKKKSSLKEILFRSKSKGSLIQNADK